MYDMGMIEAHDCSLELFGSAQCISKQHLHAHVAVVERAASAPRIKKANNHASPFQDLC
jgi:hypothetical protein